jgi:transcriptional regulator with XRE-family HTH domain
MEPLTFQRLVGERLRAARRAAGLTLEALRSRGISPKYYQRAEGGRANLTLDSLARLAQALGVGVSDLVRDPSVTADGPEGEIVLGLVLRMLRRRDEVTLHKVRTFISEILEWGHAGAEPGTTRPRRSPRGARPPARSRR